MIGSVTELAWNFVVFQPIGPKRIVRSAQHGGGGNAHSYSAEEMAGALWETALRKKTCSLKWLEPVRVHPAPHVLAAKPDGTAAADRRIAGGKDNLLIGTHL